MVTRSLAAVAGIAALVVPTTLLAQLYTAEPIGAGIGATAILDDGTVVGSLIANGTQHAVTYKAGKTTDLGAIGNFSVGTAGNANGMIVGWGDDPAYPDAGYRALAWSGGKWLDLGGLGGYGAEALAVNDAGVAVGWAQVSGAPGAQPQHAAMFRDGTVVDLGTLGGSAYATAINRAGTVVGSSRLADNITQRAFIYQNGTMTDLGNPWNAQHVNADVINNNGLIAGEFDTVDARSGVFTNQNGTWTALGALGAVTAEPHGINDTGTIVGVLDFSSGGRAFVYRNGTMLDLNVVSGFPRGFEMLTEAVAVNASGQILVLSSNRAYYVLTPTTTTEATQTITFEPMREFYIGIEHELGATATSAMPVTFTLMSGNATLSSGFVTPADGNPIVIRATQAGGAGYSAATADLTITATAKPAPPPPLAGLSGPTHASGALGKPLSIVLTPTGSPTSYFAEGLPDGLSFDTPTATITGTPVRTGVFNVWITPSNSRGAGTTFYIQLSIGELPAITSPLAVTGTVGSSFSYTVTASPSADTFTFSGLPAGLVADSTRGTITGTPTAAGTTNVAITASNGYGTSDPVTLALVIRNAGEASGPVIITSPKDEIATAGQRATLSALAAGSGTVQYQWRRSGFPIVDATNATLTIAQAKRADAGFYDVVISDASGTVDSAVIRLAVAPRQYPTAITPDLDYRLDLGDIGSTVSAVARLTDGGFIAVGDVTTINTDPVSRVFRVNADGTLNRVFSPPMVAGYLVKSVAVQADGKVLIGGDFGRVGYYQRRSLARFNVDGSVDTTFNANAQRLVTATPILLQPDQKIVVASFPGAALRRLNPDGSLERVLGAEIQGPIYALARQADGKILAVGSFTATANGRSYQNVVRLNVDGSIDPTFTGPATSVMEAVAIARDGSIYVGGTLPTGIVRLQANGTIDPSFTSPALTGDVRAVVEMGDGTILIGASLKALDGTFQNMAHLERNGTIDRSFSPPKLGGVNSLTLADNNATLATFSVYDSVTPHRGVVALAPNGSLASTPNFTVSASGAIRAIAALPDGQWLVFGGFSRAGSTTTTDVCRLNADGTVDPTLATGGGGSINGYHYINQSVALPDGRVAIAGNLFSTTADTSAAFALVDSNGRVDSAFRPRPSAVTSGEAVALLPSGKLALGGSAMPPGGNFVDGKTYPGAIAVYNLDGTLDPAFASAAPFDAKVTRLVVQTDGKMIVAGRFSAFNGTPTGAVVRLNADGTLDSFPRSGHFTTASDIAVGPTGAIYVIGHWVDDSGSFDGVVSLTADGARDPAFHSTSDAHWASLLVQEDGKVIVRAEFNPASNLPVLARLNADGSLDSTFQAVGFLPYTPAPGVPPLLMRDDGQLWYEEEVEGAEMLWPTMPVGTPSFARGPEGQTTNTGVPVTLAPVVTSLIPVSYQWQLNGLPIAGATNAKYVIQNLQPPDVGIYTLVATNDLGSTTSATAAVLTPHDARGHLSNFSIRSTAGTGDNRLIVGIVLGGDGTGGGKPLLLRGVGPTLTDFGVTNVLPDPVLELHDASGTIIAQNDDWTGSFDMSQVGAFPFHDAAPKDAALYLPAANSGMQTVHVVGKNGSTGIALAEVYDATPLDQFTVTTPRFINGSARTYVGTGDNVLILGFVVAGDTSERLLIRAVGPTLGTAPYNVSNVLGDPELEIYDEHNVSIAQNDNWGDNAAAPLLASAFSTVGAFPFSSASSKDAALIATLPPGRYSVVVRGVNDTTGVALAELYYLP